MSCTQQMQIVQSNGVDIKQMHYCGNASLHHCANQGNPPLPNTQEQWHVRNGVPHSAMQVSENRIDKYMFQI